MYKRQGASSWGYDQQPPARTHPSSTEPNSESSSSSDSATKFNILRDVSVSIPKITNKKLKRLQGVTNEKGTEIKAMLDGVVTLAEPDLFYTGGTLIFDHGHGISTLYMHMKTLMVKKGQKVKQGDVIGTVGSTGRSTGAHLDVRLNWFQVRLDPATVLDIK